ncbi:DeoR/GlpR family DNA-binding transcription regulator [Pediococcus argentinicus]|nr:DeoR/GlpR family DNA-binding transcription regulator [Pediococcus argentinicus]GEP19280.1 DeoR family transcriptional regulator [Pediococcus argentinicus]
MLKNERMVKILDAVNQEGVVTVTNLVDSLSVSSMTIRRDLDELEKEEKIVRVHGGAQSINFANKNEPSYIQKRQIHLEEKNEIAKQVAGMIEDNETIFLGPGSTNELVSKYLNVEDLRIVTNSLPVFERFRDEHDYELCLVGGTYRSRSGAFIGSLAQDFLKSIRMHKAFVGVNGIMDNSLMNANPDEGETQSIALNQSQEKYVVADHNKLNHDDFYQFYNLQDVDGLITDNSVDDEILNHYASITRVFVSKSN